MYLIVAAAHVGVVVALVHVVAAYCRKTLRRAPLKANCQTDMLPTHGHGKGDTEL